MIRAILVAVVLGLTSLSAFAQCPNGRCQYPQGIPQIQPVRFDEEDAIPQPMPQYPQSGTTIVVYEVHHPILYRITHPFNGRFRRN